MPIDEIAQPNPLSGGDFLSLRAAEKSSRKGVFLLENGTPPPQTHILQRAHTHTYIYIRALLLPAPRIHAGERLF